MDGAHSKRGEHVNYFYLKERGETESLGTTASNGPTVPALDDR
jgi:hypothetical protein